MGTQGGGYGQYCPISRAVEVLGERWSVLIIRDLLCGSTRFNDLARGNPGLSRSLLAKRLRQLERAGIVEHRGGQYLLTDAGRDLEPVVFGLGAWAARWQFDEPREEELDPQLLMWWVHGRLDFSPFGEGRTVLEFRFHGERRRFWVVHDPLGTSLCTSDPGFGVDVLVQADLAALYKVWNGRMDLTTARDQGLVELLGAPAAVRRLPEVFLLSPVAGLVQAAR